jgi:hypothetical protein
MPYATNATVVALLPDQVSTQISDSSRPSYATLTTWITDVSGAIDSALGSAGVLPASLSSAQVLALGLACAKEVAYMTMLVRAGTAGEKADAAWAAYHKDFEKLMEDIEEGGWASSASTSGSPSSYTMDSPSDTDDTINPALGRKVDF